jgi:hypothetical protein
MTEPNTNWAMPEAAPSPAGGPAPQSSQPSGPSPAPRKKGGGLTNALLLVAALVAVGGVAFAGGRMTAPKAAATGFQGPNGQGGFPGGSFDPAQGGVPGGSFQPGQGGFPGGGDRTFALTGTVKSIAGTTLVITTANGNETTIDVSKSTYHSQAAATATDVVPGATVSVQVQGFGFRRPDASAAPGASGAPGTGAITATDVTITGK